MEMGEEVAKGIFSYCELINSYDSMKTIKIK